MHCEVDKDLKDFNSWIRYGDGTKHTEITLDSDFMDWLIDYLRQEIEWYQYLLKKNQERQKKENDKLIYPQYRFRLHMLFSCKYILTIVIRFLQ